MYEELRPPLTRRLKTWHWVVLDCAVALVLTIMNVTGPPYWTPPYGVSTDVVDLLTLVTSLTVAVRRLWPLPALVVAQAGAALLALLGAGWMAPYALALVLYIVALRVSTRSAVVTLAAVVLTTNLSILFGPERPQVDNGALALTAALSLAAVWTIGRAVRQQRAYMTGLREQAARQERARAGQERLRIARELHDVVAHGMSLIAVQAGVANYVINERPEEAARALRSIEVTSRAALTEMRRLLGVLRDEDGARVDADLAPQPGLADLDRLIAQTAQAGVQIDLEVHGPRRELPAGLGLAAYRIVQEALTNVVKHADTDTGKVVVTYDDDAVSLEIVDAGRGGVPPVHAGHGLIGMRERVAAHGGRLEAGPLPRRGFRVAARLPFGDMSPLVTVRSEQA